MSDDFDGGDTITEYSSESWFGRLKGALIGLVIGIILVPGSIGLLAWNEGRAAQTARALSEGAGTVVDVSPDRVDPANQRRLVHLTGPLAVPGTLQDQQFRVAAPGAAQLVRDVEMFQWAQTESKDTHNKLGGGTETVTTYRYNKTWSSTHNDSTRFKQPDGHANPAFPYKSMTTVAPTAKLGAFTVDKAILEQTGPMEPLTPTAAPPGAHIVDGAIYVGPDAATPTIGDIRVHFTSAHPPALSVIAQQDGGGLDAFTTHNGHTLLMVQPGQVAAAQMFRQAQDDNAMLTWILRAVGTLLMLIGFVLLMNPISVLSSVLPFLGDLVGVGTFLLAILLTLTVAPIVIAIAWIAVRPLLGGGILLVAVLGAALLVGAIRRRRPAAMPVGYAVPRA